MHGARRHDSARAVARAGRAQTHRGVAPLLSLAPFAMNSQSDLSSPPSVWEFLSRSGPEDGLHATRLNTNTGPKLTSGPDWVVQRSPTEGTFYRDAAEMERFASIVTDKLSFEGFVFHSMRSSRSLCAKEDFKMEVRPTPLFAASPYPAATRPAPPPFPPFSAG